MDIAIWYVLSVVAVGSLVWSGSSRRPTRWERQLEMRLGLLERKLDAVLQHLGVPLAEPGFEDVENHLRHGNKIKAIKAYRERTGAGLKEAKDAVERMAGGR